MHYKAEALEAFYIEKNASKIGSVFFIFSLDELLIKSVRKKPIPELRHYP